MKKILLDTALQLKAKLNRDTFTQTDEMNFPPVVVNRIWQYDEDNAMVAPFRYEAFKNEDLQIAFKGEIIYRTKWFFDDVERRAWRIVYEEKNVHANGKHKTSMMYLEWVPYLSYGRIIIDVEEIMKFDYELENKYSDMSELEFCIAFSTEYLKLVEVFGLEPINNCWGIDKFINIYKIKES
tara:strand:- start:6263 stop:6808 length:546 start_codon:yes stop_codon:yes gene_type:complete